LQVAAGDDDAGSASFCDVAASYQAANSAPNPSTATAAESETTFTDLQDALDQLQAAAHRHGVHHRNDRMTRSVCTMTPNLVSW
jgi:hypothetical protein